MAVRSQHLTDYREAIRGWRELQLAVAVSQTGNPVPFHPDLGGAKALARRFRSAPGAQKLPRSDPGAQNISRSAPGASQECSGTTLGALKMSKSASGV